jgi:hypothetical protein
VRTRRPNLHLHLLQVTDVEVVGAQRLDEPADVAGRLENDGARDLDLLRGNVHLYPAARSASVSGSGNPANQRCQNPRPVAGPMLSQSRCSPTGWSASVNPLSSS